MHGHAEEDLKMPFEINTEEKGLSNSFISPVEVNKVFPQFNPPELGVTSATSGVLDTIENGMQVSSTVGSVGEDFYKSAYSVSGKEVTEVEPVYDVPSPVKEWTSEDILGLTNESVEDVLSRRGLPRVNSANTSLDILGLPKPDLTPYETNEKRTASSSEDDEKKEKIKVHFMDMFNSK